MKEGWEYKKIKDVALVVGGSTPKTNIDSYWGEGHFWVTPAELDGSKYISKTVRTITDKAVEKTNLSLLPVGTVLLSSRAPIGKVCITKKAMYCNQGFKNLVCGERLYYEYAYYFLKHNVSYIQSLGTGATFKEISKKVVEGIEIPVPPLSEQQHIVEELDLLSSIIEKKKAQLKELDNLAQSIFYEMFGDLFNTKFDIKTLNDICELIKDGTHQTPKYTEDKKNGVKFLSAKDVVEGFINWKNIKYIPYTLHAELNKRISPQRDDLLLCKNGTTGICAIVETDEIFDIYVSLALLRPKKPNQPRYLLYAINNPLTKQQFDESLKGVGVPNLHLGEIKKTKIIVPPLPLQELFASKIQSIEHQKALIKQSITEVETLFNSRMDYYFN